MDNLTLKPSQIKKNQDIKPSTLENTQDTYNDYTDIINNINREKKMDGKLLSSLIDDINQLPREDHLNIYVFLRSNGVESNFFSKSKKATHFDIDLISNRNKWKLYMHVNMLQESNNRSKTISKLTEQHNKNLQRLDSQLEREHSERHEQSVHQPATDTETAKLEKMLHFNNVEG